MKPAPTTAVASRFEAKLTQAVTGVALKWADAVPEQAVERVAFNPSKVMSLLSPDRWGKHLVSSVKPIMVSAFNTGAEVSVDHLKHAIGVTKAPATATFEGRFSIGFDAINDLAVAWASRHAAELVVATLDIQRIIRAAVTAAQADGTDVRVLARILRGFIGLDPGRMRALERFSESLLAKDLPIVKVQSRVQRYAHALVRSRAMTIARTESIAAINAGQQALWDNAVEQGMLRKSAMVKTWIVTPDELLCPICEALDGEQAEIDGHFEGEFEGEGFDGPPAHPNCRCAMGLVRR